MLLCAGSDTGRRVRPKFTKPLKLFGRTIVSLVPMSWYGNECSKMATEAPPRVGPVVKSKRKNPTVLKLGVKDWPIGWFS